MPKQHPTASYFDRLMNDWSSRRLPVDVAMRQSAALAVRPVQPGIGHNMPVDMPVFDRGYDDWRADFDASRTETARLLRD